MRALPDVPCKELISLNTSYNSFCSILELEVICLPNIPGLKPDIEAILKGLMIE